MRICLELGKFGTAETLVFGPRYAMVNTCPIDFFKLQPLGSCAKGLCLRWPTCSPSVSCIVTCGWTTSS